MGRVAIISDSAADLPPDEAAARGIDVVALEVTFGDQRFRAGLDLSVTQFWERMLGPDAPFPKTAAPSAGEFKVVFEAAFAAGADAIVCVNVGDKLSGTIKSARIARDLLPDREIHIVDSDSASMAVGILAEIGSDMAKAGVPAAEIAAELERRRDDIEVYVALDTLEYLRRGGRLSTAQAAVGTLLSVKPILTIRDGVVDVIERIRTRSKARARMVELLTERPVERMAILRTTESDEKEFVDEVLERLAPQDRPGVGVYLIGPSIGPHVGPGAVGAAILRRRA